MTLTDRKKAFDRISRSLALTSLDIQYHQAINDQSQNIHAEDYFKDIFNFLYRAKFKNANISNLNEAYIDLIDTENQKIVQVTTTRTKAKILHSLKALTQPQYKDYDFSIYYLHDKAMPNSDTIKDIEAEYPVNLKSILKDYTDLLADINSLEGNRLIELADTYFTEKPPSNNNTAQYEQLLLRTIKIILSNLRDRKFNDAKATFKTLKSASNFDDKANRLFDILSIRIGVHLKEDIEIQTPYQMIKSFQDDYELNSFEIDLCNDTLIRLDVKNTLPDDASQKYQSIEEPGINTVEAFYELLASENDLQQAFNGIGTDEFLLAGLLRGCIRLKSHKLAQKVSSKLSKVSSSFNTRLLSTYTDAITFEHEISTIYWSITNTERENLISHADDILLLIDECGGEDDRCLALALTFLDYFEGQHQGLFDACKNHVSRIEAISPDAARRIKNSIEGNIENLDEHRYKVAKSAEDRAFRLETVDSIIKEKSLTPEESAVFARVGSAIEVKKWINDGGEVAGTDQFSIDFSMLELKAFSLDEHPLSLQRLREDGESFIAKYVDRLKNIAHPRLLDISNLMQDIGLPEISCQLLKPSIPEIDIWPSPLVRCYIRALLASQKMSTINSVLNEIEKNQWDGFIWHIKASVLDHSHETKEAIEALTKSLEIDDSSLQAWTHLIHVYVKHNYGDERILEALNKIPVELFNNFTDHGLSLLHEMTVLGNFNFAEERVLAWFYDDPDTMAIPLTNFNFNALAMTKYEAVFSDTVGHCIKGLHYKIDNNLYTKLLTDDDQYTHSVFISSTSPIGEALSTATVNEVIQLGMQDIELLGVMSPFQAAISIATQLRQANNDGKDCFHMFEPPSDPEEMVAYLEKKLGRGTTGNENIIADSKIPIFLKCHHLRSNDPMMSALQYLTTKKPFQHAIPALGDEQPDKVIIDVHTIAYLALTGLYKNIESFPIKYVISLETKKFLQDWLKTVNNQDFMTLDASAGRGVTVTTYEQIQESTVEVREAVNLFLELSEVVAPELKDIPDEVLKIEGTVDLSVLSSLKLSITNSIHWLCIDQTFAQLSAMSGYKLANANFIFSGLGRGMNIKDKKNGLYLHASSTLPYSLTFEDFYLLSQSNDEHAYHFLAELLSMYPNAFSDTGSAISFLHDILTQVLARAYQDGEILNGLRGSSNPQSNGYVERVFNTACFMSMQCKDGKEAEEKLALLLVSLIKRFSEIPRMVKLIRLMGAVFISGHFMSFDAINSWIDKYWAE